MVEPALVVEEVSKRFANFWAVQKVSFRVEVGERVAIIGPNGAGKTTLLNILGGQATASSGRIHFFGKDMSRVSLHARASRGVARSFQVPSVFPEETVAHNVWLGAQRLSPYRFRMLRRAKVDQGDPHLRSVLDKWGLWEQRDRFPDELAHGDRRRLELALALSANPRLLLLDEPTAGLTVQESPRLVAHVNELGRDVTVLLVDHDMATIFAFAERIIVMHRGQVLADGTPEAVRSDRQVADAYGVEGKL